MFDFAGAAQAIIFVSALAGLAIFGPLCLTYASHCFLVVLTESSIGDREVRWPDESIGEWLWKPLYCLAHLAFWASVGAMFLAPLFLVNRWLAVIVSGVYLWFAYPIGLMCVMDARNALAVFYVPLLARLGRHFPYVLFVAAATLPLGAAAGGLLALAILHSTLWALPAAIVAPPVLFLYARFWGRLAWLLLNVKGRPARPGEVQPAGAERASVHDPWALPQPQPVPEIDVEVEEPRRSVADPHDEWAEHPAPYQVTSAAATSSAASSGPEAPSGEGEPQLFSHEKYYQEYRKREEARKARAEGHKPGEKRRRRATFRHAFGADLWPFLNERRTLRAGLSLAVATAGFLVLLRIAILMLPTG